MRELWSDVKGYEGLYRVSNRGRVKSLPRVIIRGKGIRQPIKGTFLSTDPDKKSLYVVVNLRSGKRSRYFYVHRLVAQAFIPNSMNLPEVNHKDLNKKNNRVDNLEWVTSKGNHEHAKSNGVMRNPPVLRGEDCPHAKLNWEKARKIRKLYAVDPIEWNQYKLAERFHVTQANIWSVLKNKTWVEYQDQKGLTLPFVRKD